MTQPDPVILVVEDGLDNQILVKMLIGGYTSKIDFAKDGEEAVRQYARKRYDIVLLDMQLPLKDGYAVAKEIRSMEDELERKPAFIVATTAYTDEERITNCYKSGCNEVLHKPLTAHALFSLLRRAEIETAPRIYPSGVTRKLLHDYLQRRDEDLTAIIELLLTRDFEEISRIGHRMKGSGSAYGLHEISHFGDEIEKAAIRRSSLEMIDLLHSFRQYLNSVYQRDDRT